MVKRAKMGRPSGDPQREITAIIREHGQTWVDVYGQSLVWAFLVYEIPNQVLAYNTTKLDRLKERLSFLEQHYPGDEENERVKEQIMCRRPVGCTLTAPTKNFAATEQCIIASVHHSVGQWPEDDERRVEFSICKSGELSIRCINTPDDKPKLPAFVKSPWSPQDAHEQARSLARAAASLVDHLPKPIPSALISP